MSARPVWKGFLKIALVTIPIKVFPATESSSGLSFNQLHADCQSRIQQKKWCPTCAREVPTAEIVKGYEFETGKYAILLPEELDAVQPPSTKVIDLTQFADEALLHPLFIDRSYYLAPDGPLAAEAFVVLREGMIGQAGIGKLAIYGREYLVAVRPHQYTLLLHTLHHAAEIRSIKVVEDVGEAVAAAWDPRQVAAARQVIAALHGPLDLAAFADQYAIDVRHLIDDKIAGREIVVPPVAETPAIANLRDALTASLQHLSARKKTPATVKAAAAPTRKRA
jgi:DNA end-binding protein Ku